MKTTKDGRKIKEHKNFNSSLDLNDSHLHLADTRSYFRQLRFRLLIGFLIALIIPFAALSVYFHFQFTFTLKESAKLNLIAISESQRNTVDLFLQERVVNLFSQFQSENFNLTPSRGIMENYLKNLRRVSDAFVDVGFLNEKGTQIGYAGPYPYLQDKLYAEENWFQILIQQDRNHLISDIYLGFRNKPHFTIAVKQVIDGRLWVMRSTLDPDKLYVFLRTISHAKGVDSALINREGIYQIVDPGRGELLGFSDFRPTTPMGTGVMEVKKDRHPLLVAYAWLAETPWALVAIEPLRISHGPMYQARRIIIASTTLILVMITIGIWVAINRLTDRARRTAESREELQQQLLHASKLASVGELATGVAHEINNPLAIVLSTTGVIRDMLNPEFKLDASPENILKELDTVESAVFRARNITRQLLDFGRKEPPRPKACNLNRLIDDVLGGFKRHALEVENITIEKQYEANLPDIIADHDQIRQVLLNLINNAGDAISASGTITISTASDGQNVRVTITDTGRGMTTEQMKKIFKPFYTTKAAGKGTGLGLSVSRGIVTSMGGSIEVQSMPGAGSSFTVILPIDFTERQDDAAASNTQQS